MAMNLGQVGSISGAGAPNYLDSAEYVHIATVGGTEYAFVVSSADESLSIFNVSTPATPTLTGVIRGAGAPNYLDFPRGVFVYTIGGTEYAFVASAGDDDALSIFDVSTPATPVHVGVISGNGAPNYLGTPYSVHVVTIGGTEYAFVASASDGALSIFDVSTPATPTFTGVISGAGAPNYLDFPFFVRVETVGGTEYAFVTSYMDNALTIINVSTPATPTLTGVIRGLGPPNYLGGARHVCIATVGGTEYAFVASSDDALVIIDVSTPATPTLTGEIHGTGAPNYLSQAHSVDVVDIDGTEYAFVGALDDNTLVAINVSTPATPTFADVVTDLYGPSGIDVATISGIPYIFLAERTLNALIIFNNVITNVTSTVGTNGGLRDYTSLSAWESDKQRDLTIANETETAECYNDGIMTNNVTIAGWTTDANRWIKVYTPTAERHTGTLGTGFRYNGGAALAIYIQMPNVTIEGLSIKTTASGNYCIQTDIAAAHTGSISLSHNLLEGNGIMLLTNSLTTGFSFYVWNNFIVGWNSGARSGGAYGIRVQINNANIPCYLYSNTLFGCSFDGFGFAFNHPICRVKDCLAVNCGTYDFRNPTYVHGDSDYNGSSAAVGDADKAPGANSIHSMVAADSFINVTGGSEDLHTKNASSDQFQAGMNLSADADLPFSDDIDGETRGVPWDMGADNNLAAVVAAANSVMHIMMQMMAGR